MQEDNEEIVKEHTNLLHCLFIRQNIFASRQLYNHFVTIGVDWNVCVNKKKQKKLGKLYYIINTAQGSQVVRVVQWL